MAEDLSIINLHEKNETKHPLPHPFLPNPEKCFRMLIFSPSNSGKSNLIKNLITRPEFGYTTFYKQNIFLFSPTIRIDPIWQDISLPKTHDECLLDVCVFFEEYSICYGVKWLDFELGSSSPWERT
jgi:hypothetical protein